MRVFVAIDLAPEVRARIGELELELTAELPRTKFVPAGNLHLTLRFLGETSRELLDSVVPALESAALAAPRFDVHVQGCGVFPDARRPRVLWVGVASPPESLLELQKSIERVFRESGFPPEKRRFAPHLTIARFREPERGLQAVLGRIHERDLGVSPVEEVLVYESRLSPRGSTYIPLHRFPLGSSGT